MKKGPTNKSIRNGYGTIAEVEMEAEPKEVIETGAPPLAKPLRYYSPRSFRSMSIYALTHVELATLPLLPFIERRQTSRQLAMLLTDNPTVLPTILGKAALPASVVSLLEGTACVTEILFPTAFWAILLHDVITFYTQVDDRYGTTLESIFLGSASNALAWSSIYGTDLAQETLHSLIPALASLALSVSALSQLLYDRYRLTIGKASEEAIHTELSIRFLRHTALWHADTALRLQALKRLGALSQAPSSLSQRLRALSMIEQVASSFQANHHQDTNHVEPLHDVALNILTARANHSEDPYTQYYACYLSWSLGDTNRKKMDALLLPLALIYLCILIAKIRLAEMWWTKACELIDYNAAKKACEQQNKVYTLTQSGHNECTVCGDWSFVYYGDIHTSQGCLDGLLASIRNASFILKQLSSIQEHLNRYADFSVIDLSKQDLATAWTEAEWNQFCIFFETIPNLHLTLFNVSTSSVKPLNLSQLKLERLAKFIQQVPMDGLDFTGQYLGSDSIDVFFERVANNTALTDLRFSSSGSGDFAACKLATILVDTRISTLITGYNNVTDYGIDCYTAVLSKTKIHTFYAPGNAITEIGMLPFIRNLHHTHIRHLDISDTALSVDTANSLGQQLGFLSSLNLSQCQLTDTHLRYWLDYAPNATIEMYDLSRNVALTGQHIIPFLAAQSTSRQLDIHLAGLVALNSNDYRELSNLLTRKNIQLLNVAYTMLSCADLTSLIANHSQLHTLIATNNQLTDACMPAFCQSLALQTQALHHLDLANNKMSSLGVSQLFSRLPDTPLQILNLAGNQLTGVEFSDYPQAIAQSRLTELNIGQNVISTEFIVQLLNSTLMNTTLKKLDLRGATLTEAHGLLLAQHLIPPIPHLDSLSAATLTRDQQRLLHNIQTASINETLISQLILSNTQMDEKSARALCHVAPVAHLTVLDLNANGLAIDNIHQCSASGASRTEPGFIFNLPRYVHRTFKHVWTSTPEIRTPVAAAATFLPSLSANNYSAPMHSDVTCLAMPTLLLAVMLIKSWLNSRPNQPPIHSKK